MLRPFYILLMTWHYKRLTIPSEQSQCECDSMDFLARPMASMVPLLEHSVFADRWHIISPALQCLCPCWNTTRDSSQFPSCALSLDVPYAIPTGTSSWSFLEMTTLYPLRMQSCSTCHTHDVGAGTVSTAHLLPWANFLSWSSQALVTALDMCVYISSLHHSWQANCSGDGLLRCTEHRLLSLSQAMEGVTKRLPPRCPSLRWTLTRSQT